MTQFENVRWPTAVLNVSHTRLPEVTSSILGESGFENVRWPSGSTERFSHTTTRGRQFDTRGQRGGTGLAKKIPTEISGEVALRGESSYYKKFNLYSFENVRWPSGSTERFSHTTTRGR
ncbi:hypothetical protein HID58_063005 [Brassica napus]|uniref:Uncharacterized protein n=1 Tax=Brassica napus TaxID=3708 RepID=A0ABQ8A323_BRANA|nr:hypothetical protein HID58_063005 [Brassica napus]